MFSQSTLITIVVIAIQVTSGHDTHPVVTLKPNCPKTTRGIPRLAFTADVPAQSIVRCKNGDVGLTSLDNSLYSVEGRFNQKYKGKDCLFFKPNASEVYSVTVKVGLKDGQDAGLKGAVRTVSCVYDQYGLLVPSSNQIQQWFVTPWDEAAPQDSKTISMSLKVVNVLGDELNSTEISVGRKIQLIAEGQSNKLVSYRAHSCLATNGVISYYILQAGCGDGRVFNKTTGFKTLGGRVVSPFFNSFQLRGGRQVEFYCRFQICGSACDGNSCSPSTRRHSRSVMDIITSSFVGVSSGPVFLSPLR